MNPAPINKQYAKPMPPGAYLARIVWVGDERVSRSGHKMKRIDFQLEGYDRRVTGWSVMLDREGVNPPFADRLFLIELATIRYKDEDISRVAGVLCEVES